MSLVRWLIRRCVSLLGVLLLVTLGTSALLELLPGNKAIAILGTSATPESIKIVEKNLNLDRSFPVRYAIWTARAVQGDLGIGRDGELVSASLRQRVPTSLELLVEAQFVAVALAVAGATYATKRANRRPDKALSATAFGMVALPQFVIGLLFVIFLAGKWRLFPLLRHPTLVDDPLGHLRSIALPVLTLAIPLAGIYFRVLRTDLGATMQMDFITRARASGLSERRILFNHALRPSSLSLLSIVGLNTAAVLGGSIVVENLFAVPGLGRLLLESVAKRDLVKVQGAVLAIGLIYVIVNLTVDLLLQVLDPRVRIASSGSVT
jgi:peptide/nickel transport system permease protein